jgi:molybdopterin/thiamine biosynthesis adenylyltransferase
LNEESTMPSAPSFSSVQSEQGTSAVASPAAVISGSLCAHLVLSLITGIPNAVAGQMQGVNLLDATHHFLLAHDANPECDVCGRSVGNASIANAHARNKTPSAV